MRTQQIDLGKDAYEEIDTALHKRLPYMNQLRIDNQPEFIHQADIYGNVDSIISIGGSEQFIINQCKSRNENVQTICFECRSFSGLPYNANSGKHTTIAGAHFVQSLNVYLSPRFGSCQTVSYYMSRERLVLHLSRYFLDVLFSGEAIWQHVKQIFFTNDSIGTYVIYINWRTFITLYMQCIVRVTLGDRYVMKLEETDEEKISN